MSDLIDSILRLVPKAALDSNHEMAWPHRYFYKVKKWRDGYGGTEQELNVCPMVEADLVGSLCFDGEIRPLVAGGLAPKGQVVDRPGFMHAPVIDIDMPCRLIPSKTPGHFHLYIDTKMPWKTYEKLLDALVEAGIVESGFRNMAKKDGQSFARIPKEIEDEVS